MGATVLRGLLTAAGIVAVVAGSLSAFMGAEQVIGGGRVPPNFDSEYRFYAVWYVIAGVLLLRSARRLESEGFVVRLLALGFLAAGISRVVSMTVVGRPDALYLALMVLEFVVALVILALVRMPSSQ